MNSFISSLTIITNQLLLEKSSTSVCLSYYMYFDAIIHWEGGLVDGPTMPNLTRLQATTKVCLFSLQIGTTVPKAFPIMTSYRDIFSIKVIFHIL